MKSWSFVDRRTLAAGGVVLLAVAAATAFLPTVGLTTADTAITEGGGGSVRVLLARVVRSVYFGPFEAEQIGWSAALLAALAVLAVVWLAVGRPHTRGISAIAVFCAIVAGTYYYAYSNALNAIGFSPNLIIMYMFVPLVGLSGAGVAWLIAQMTEREPAMTRRSVTYWLVIGLVLVFVANAGYEKALSLRESAQAGSFVKLQDVAGLEWIRDHTKPNEGIVVDGLSDAGFWAPALADRRTLFWYMGWPSLPPWSTLSALIEDPAPSTWETIQVQLVGSDITVRGLGPRKGSDTSNLFVSGSGGSYQSAIESDSVTVHMPDGQYVLALVYMPAYHRDSAVTVDVATPGGGRRVYRAADNEMRRRYFSSWQPAIDAAQGARSPGLLVSDFKWAKLRREGYRYIFLGSTVGDPERSIINRPALRRSPELRRVWSAGGASIYEILPEDTSTSSRAPVDTD